MKKLVLLFLSCIAFSCHNTTPKTVFSKEVLSEKLMTTDIGQIAFQNILNKHQGKTLVIKIWASWCSDCIKSMSKFKELQAQNPDVSYVFISLDKTADQWKTGIEKHQLKGDHYRANDGMNGAFGQAIDLDWIPRYLIVDKTGKIVTYNAIETDFKQINKTLKELN
jgi:thiol-disulfide isomerase/thioredoxin